MVLSSGEEEDAKLGVGPPQLPVTVGGVRWVVGIQHGFSRNKHVSWSHAVSCPWDWYTKAPSIWDLSGHSYDLLRWPNQSIGSHWRVAAVGSRQAGHGSGQMVRRRIRIAIANSTDPLPGHHDLSTLLRILKADKYEVY